MSFFELPEENSLSDKASYANQLVLVQEEATKQVERTGPAICEKPVIQSVDQHRQSLAVPPIDPEELIAHKEMCKLLGIGISTGHDWRSRRSPRYKKELAELAIYLSENTVRFRRADILKFAKRCQLEVQS